MKHVLPKFASPAPIFRAAGHSILMFAAGYSASFTATPFGSVASSRGVARERGSVRAPTDECRFETVF